MKRRALLILLSVIALALVEGAARLLPLGLPDLADRHLAWAVGTDPVFVASGDRLVTAAELAHQDNSPESFSRRKAPGVVRVVCVGDSTTAGWPYHPVGAYPRWLAAILADVRPDLRFEVVNAGFHGFDSARCLSVLRETLAYGPDVVVFRAGYNDYHLYPARHSRVTAAHLWLVRRLQIYNLARWLVGRRGGRYSLQPVISVLSEEQQDALVRAYLDNVRAASGAVRGAGATPVLAGLPYSQKAAPGFPAWPSIMRMKAALPDLAAREGLAFASLSALDDGARFVDKIHNDAQGYRLTALDVAHAIERSGAFPGRWRWDRVRPPRALAEAIGLDARFQAKVDERLALARAAR